MMMSVVLKRKMGRRLPPPCNTRQMIQKASAAICLVKHDSGFFSCGVAILYPTPRHPFFIEETSLDPRMFWRGMYAASKMLCVGKRAVEIALKIAGRTPLSNSFRKEATEYLLYDYTADSLREEVFAQEIPSAELAKITEGLQIESCTRVNPKNESSFMRFLTQLQVLRDNASWLAI